MKTKNTLLGIIGWGLVIHMNGQISNTTLGYDAGNTGLDNTSIGYEAGTKVTGNSNTFVGASAGNNNTSGTSNVFIGAGSGQYNAGGIRNVFVGRNSGVNNQRGGGNVFLGFQSGFNHQEGWQNVFIGYETGKNSYSSKKNVFLGSYAGYHIHSAEENVFLGYESGYKNNFGKENTFLGSRSGRHNETGNFNTFVGKQTGYYNTSGTKNSFFGLYSGYSNTTGQNNNFFGAHAGQNNITGHDNSFFGSFAGLINKGSQNVFIGNKAGQDNQDGWANTYLGFEAGKSNNGHGNVFIGVRATKNRGGISNKLFIQNGNLSNLPIIYGDFESGDVAIGQTYSAGYRLYINGDAYATGLWIDSGIIPISARKKSNPISNALQKITKINSAEYVSKNSKTSSQGNKQITNYVLNAEDVQKNFPGLVKNNDDHVAVNYQGLIPVLIEAIKELKQQNEELKQMIVNDQEEEGIESGITENHSTGFEVSQNLPNPIISTSIITYAIPVGYENMTTLKIFDLNGRLVKEFSGLKSGRQQLRIEKSALPSGIYTYGLHVGKKVISSKKMVIR